ncbi:poly-beta-1,6-N-acetyl-D-glucosamine N-deacetylase PgaB [Neisseria sp.]
MKKASRLLFPLIAAFGLNTALANADVRYGVLCYHDVIDLKAPPKKLLAGGAGKAADTPATKYYSQTLSTERLIAHFNWLRDNGYTPVSWQQIEDARKGRGKLPAKPVLLTFDDGYKSFYTTIYPLLKAYKYPAVYAVVTGWMEKKPHEKIAYGKDEHLPRSEFITWAQLREMQAGGLIEVASHTHDMHRGQQGNPGGSQFAAVFPGNYQNGKYETPEQYRNRVRQDLKTSSDLIAKHTGRRPRLMVWPYGQFNLTAVAIARELGFADDLTLFDNRTNTLGDRSVGRALIDQETPFSLLKSYLEGTSFEVPHRRSVYVKLDDMYHPDPQQQAKNYDRLVDRIYRLGATSVYLQAVSDSDGNGKADTAYFPNRHLKTKADIFSQVAWQLITRANVNTYAWMPVDGFDFKGVSDGRKAAAELYEDLAFNSRFKGLAFGYGANDGANTDTAPLTQAAMRYSYNGQNEMKTVRALYPMPSENPAAFAQKLPAYTQRYDYTAVMIQPYLQDTGLRKLLDTLQQSGAAQAKTQIMFGNPLQNSRFDGRQLAQQMRQTRKAGYIHFGYGADGFLNDNPELKTVKPDFAARTGMF